MIIGAIHGANTIMRGDGDTVRDLHVIRTEDGRFISAWIPTPAELHALNQGASVHLSIWGDGHPPVYVGVDGVP